MVRLTSCVFRSIRFSGFARPHRLGCGARENYTRRRRAGASMYRRVHRMDTNWGILFVYVCVCPSAREGRVHSGAAVPTPDAPQPRGPSRMRRRHGHGRASPTTSRRGPGPAHARRAPPPRGVSQPLNANNPPLPTAGATDPFAHARPSAGLDGSPHGAGSSAHAGTEHLVLPPPCP